MRWRSSCCSCSSPRCGRRRATEAGRRRCRTARRSCSISTGRSSTSDRSGRRWRRCAADARRRPRCRCATSSRGWIAPPPTAGSRSSCWTSTISSAPAPPICSRSAPGCAASAPPASRSTPIRRPISTTATISRRRRTRRGSTRSARCCCRGRAAPGSTTRACSTSWASTSTSSASAPTSRSSSPTRGRRRRLRRRPPTRRSPTACGPITSPTSRRRGRR